MLNTNATVTQETDNKPKYIKVVATDDIIVSIKITDKAVKASAINIQTNNGTVYIHGFVRKAEKGEHVGEWFFAMPNHIYGDAYINDAGCDKQLMGYINKAINKALQTSSNNDAQFMSIPKGIDEEIPFGQN